MREQVFLNRVSVDYQALYKKAKDYFAKHGIQIDFEFIPCDFQLSYQTMNFPQGQRTILMPYMANIVPINTSYDFTSFVFNGREFPPPNIPTGYCYCPMRQPFIDILTDELNPKDVDYVTICHEHMHALVFKANQAGFQTNDVMDTYRENINPESPTGNFAEQWGLLQPYLHSLQSPTMPPDVSKPQVTITRRWDNGSEYLGDLTMNGFSAKTLELPWRLNMQNVSCIPRGTYNVKWTFSMRFLRYTYEVQNVPNRSGIRFHPANFFFDLKGCIALGDKYADLNHDAWADLINSSVTIKTFENLLAKRDFQLIIQ